MKKMPILLTMLVVSLSSIAYAGDYSDAVTNQSLCGNLGDLSVEYFHKQAGSKAKIDKFIAGLQLPADADPRSAQSRASESARVALTYALRKATSEKDAYMHGWAACMDGNK